MGLKVAAVCFGHKKAELTQEVYRLLCCKGHASAHICTQRWHLHRGIPAALLPSSSALPVTLPLNLDSPGMKLPTGIE